MAVTSLFVIGAGMAVLQVAINPLLRVAGGEENFAFNSAFAQLIFGAASFVSPLVYSDLMKHLDPAHLDLTGIYGVLEQHYHSRASLGIDLLDICRDFRRLRGR